MIYLVNVRVGSEEKKHIVQVRTQVGIGDWKPSFEIDRDIKQYLQDYYKDTPVSVESVQECSYRYEGVLL